VGRRHALATSKPGESLVTIILKDYTPKKEVPEAWYQVRKKIGDIRHTFRPGVQGPFINDEFGDTFINIFALTGDGFDLARCARRPTAWRANCARCRT
jgi:multidrug efflux pump